MRRARTWSRRALKLQERPLIGYQPLQETASSMAGELSSSACRGHKLEDCGSVHRHLGTTIRSGDGICQPLPLRGINVSLQRHSSLASSAAQSAISRGMPSGVASGFCPGLVCRLTTSSSLVPHGAADSEEARTLVVASASDQSTAGGLPWNALTPDPTSALPIQDIAPGLQQGQGALHFPWSVDERLPDRNSDSDITEQQTGQQEGTEKSNSFILPEGLKVPSERPPCLKPRWVNFVLKNEVTTIKEVLAVVWAQGHCRTFARINMGMSMHRLALMVSSAPPDRREKLRKQLMQHPAFEYLLSLIHERTAETTPWSVSMIIWALGKLYYTPAERGLLDKLVQRSVSRVYNDIGLSNTLWGLSALGHKPDTEAMAVYEAKTLKLMQATLAEEGNPLQKSAEALSDAKAEGRAPFLLGTHSFSVIILAFAKLGHRVSEETAEVALQYIQRFLGELSQQGLVNIILCTRKSALGISLSDHLWEEVQQRLEGLVDSMSTQDMTMCLASFAISGHMPKQSVVDKILLRLRDRLDTLTNADLVAALSTMCSAPMTADNQLAPRLRELIIKKSTSGQMDSEALTMVLIALSKADGTFGTGAELDADGSIKSLDFELLKSVCDELLLHMKNGTISTASIVASLWSLAKMHYFPSFKFMDTYSRELLELVRADGVADYHLASLMWSLSELRWYDNRILDSVSHKLLDRLGRGERLLSDARQYGQMLVPFGVFGQKTSLAKPMAEELLAVAQKYLRSPSCVEDEENKLQVSLTSVMWAMALLGQLQTPAGVELSKVTQELFVLRGSTSSLCSQLYHAHLMAENHGTPMTWVSQELRDRCRRSWQQSGTTTVVSEFQGEVFKHVQQLTPGVRMEVGTDDCLFFIDMGFTDAMGQRVAVEADGPMHYTSGYPYIPLKMFDIRNDMLRKAGYIVVNVEFYAWRREPNKLSFLRELLVSSGVVL